MKTVMNQRWELLRRSAFRGTFGILLALALAAGGCSSGGSTHPVAKLGGSVTIGGQPLPADAQGQIQFFPEDSGQPDSAPIEEGRYLAQRVPLGQVKVLFKITRPTGRKIVEEGARGGAPFDELENLVPAQYRNGLSLEVTEDNLSQDFAL